jgi:hypothetical protein
MAIKSEIAWKRAGPDGERLEIYARRFGGQWRFHSRTRRNDDWKSLDPAPLEDWIELIDAVARRVPRRLFPPAELDRVRREALERYPEARAAIQHAGSAAAD